MSIMRDLREQRKWLEQALVDAEKRKQQIAELEAQLDAMGSLMSFYRKMSDDELSKHRLAAYEIYRERHP